MVAVVLTAASAESAAAGAGRVALLALAQVFSPRSQLWADNEVVIDASGLTRLFGDARELGQQIRRTAADRGMQVRVALAATTTAARLLVRSRAGVTVVDTDTQQAMLAPVPLTTLLAVAGDEPASGAERLATFRRWGLRTLGDLVALDAASVAARLGQDGVRWQRLARGDDPRPLDPEVPEERFEQALDLEWPIEGLEPLSFVLGRLMEPLAAHLERRDRSVAVLRVQLHLVTKVVHARAIELPAALRDARTLRTLALLDLESHPPEAAIDRVVVAVEPTPAKSLQFSLLTRPLPAPEQMSTLVARLQAVMGEGRCGAPSLVDSWSPGACAVAPFTPVDLGDAPRASAESGGLTAALRRFRIPVPARVRTEAGAPIFLATDRQSVRGGAIATTSGPWRTSGGWWDDAWDRDEWEVTLRDGVSYRLFRERQQDAWFVDAVID